MVKILSQILFTPCSDFISTIKSCGGDVLEIQVKNELSYFSSNSESICIPHIPEKAKIFLKSCHKRDYIMAAKLPRPSHHICFQWHPGDQKALAFYLKPAGFSECILYEYDINWLRCFPFLESRTGEWNEESTLCIRSCYTLERMELDFKEIFIGGSNNISHFIGNILPRIYYSRVALGLTPVLFCLSKWQRTLLDLCIGKHQYREIDISSYNIKNSRNILQVCDNSGYTIEDIPSFVGLPISMSILEALYTEHNYSFESHTTPKRIYLCRTKYEFKSRGKNHGFTFNRNIAWRECIGAARIHGYTLIFPEEWNFFDLYHMLTSAEKVVCDYGSCNMHILSNTRLLSRIKTTNAKVTIAWQPVAVDKDLSSDFARNYEWLLPVSSLGQLGIWPSIKAIDNTVDFLEPSTFSHQIFEKL